MTWTAPRTWVAGEVVTAAQLNTHLRDNLLVLSDPWASWTPSWTATSVNPAIGNGTLIGRVIQTGKRVEGYISLVAGSTTTFGTGAWIFSMPVTPESGRLFSLPGTIDDDSSGLYPVFGLVQDSVTIDVRTTPTTAGNILRGVSATVPMTWTTADSMLMPFIYEAA